MTLNRNTLQKKRGQAAAEYLILMGMVVALTLAAFSQFLPQIIAADGESGHAFKFFCAIIQKINCGPGGEAGCSGTCN